MSKPTPGPWVVETILDRFNVYIAGPACLCIARDCTAQDARLIAAAPELLAALRLFVEPAEGLPVYEKSPMAQARAAVEKAEGT